MAYRDTEAVRDARARIAAGEGYLYVAEVVGTDVVKIGFSLDPESRVKTAWPFTGEPLRLLGFFPCSLLSEKKLHREHLRKHTSNEHGNEYYPRSIFTDPTIFESLRATPAPPAVQAAIAQAEYQTDPAWAAQLVERAVRESAA